MREHTPLKKDLIVLVADKSQEMAIDTLLKNRRRSLGIRGITYDIDRHPQHDPGIYKRGALYLSTFAEQYYWALVVLDAQWEGTPGTKDIQKKLTQELAEMGWKGRSKVIVIDPELEVWVWSTSPHVATILGIPFEHAKELGRENGWWHEKEPKPCQPKLLLDYVLRQEGKSKSASWFGKLAREVGIANCADASFCELKAVLKEWFPIQQRD